MVEGVIKARGLISLARDLGFGDISNVVYLGTDRAEAKSFVCRRGLGRMKHIEIRDLWIQKEVAEGRLEVGKIWGIQNPADRMTKYLGIEDIKDRLRRMNLWTDC